jgi:mRNA-degrading endonuclease HigB of HigAB toxin-antitoxin module
MLDLALHNSLLTQTAKNTTLTTFNDYIHRADFDSPSQLQNLLYLRVVEFGHRFNVEWLITGFVDSHFCFGK